MPRLLVSLLGAAVALAACGSREGTAPPAPPQPVSAQPADFPAAAGRTLGELVDGLTEGAILNTATTHSQRAGVNRLGFTIVDRANKQIDVSAVAVYTARADGSRLRGPFVARKESLAVDTEHRSAQTAADLQNGETFYVAAPRFESSGRHLVVGLVRLDGRLVVADSPSPLEVDEKNPPPLVGEPAIVVHTQTGRDVGGVLTKLSTRIPPPPQMLEHDFADIVGRRPAVLLFATPALCQSRTCGPVVDIAEQVRAQSGRGVAFIQQEIYQDNDPGKPVRPQVSRWRLPSEPWAFVVDRRGDIAARFEGVFSVAELARAVQRVAGR